MSEQFGIYRSVGNRSAVDGNVFVVFASRKCVNDLREKLLADTALARYEYRKVGRSDTHGNLQSPIEQFRVADDAESLFNGSYIYHIFFCV